MKSTIILVLSIVATAAVMTITPSVIQQTEGAAFVARCNADQTDCTVAVSDDKSETQARQLNGVTLVDGQPPHITHQKINTLP